MRRREWQADDVREAAASGRRGAGTVNHCIHGRDAIVEEILDYRPYDHVTIRFQMPAPGSPKFITSDVLTPLGDGGTRVETRIGRPRSRDRAAFEQLLPLFQHAVAASYAELAPRLEQVAARARSAAAEEAGVPPPKGRHLSQPVVG